MRILILLFCLQLIPIYATNVGRYIPETTFAYTIDTQIAPALIKFTRKNVNGTDPAMVLAGIANYECGNLSAYERWLVMEAMWNRVVSNYNNNGKTLARQIFAHRQIGSLSFNGRASRFYFDSKDPLHVENYLMALRILNGSRLFPNDLIVYWANPTDSHRKTVERRAVKTAIKTAHKFCK